MFNPNLFGGKSNSPFNRPPCAGSHATIDDEEEEEVENDPIEEMFWKDSPNIVPRVSYMPRLASGSHQDSLWRNIWDKEKETWTDEEDEDEISPPIVNSGSKLEETLNGSKAKSATLPPMANLATISSNLPLLVKIKAFEDLSRERKLDLISVILWRQEFIKSKANPTQCTDDQVFCLWEKLPQKEKLTWRSTAGTYLFLREKEVRDELKASKNGFPQCQVPNSSTATHGTTENFTLPTSLPSLRTSSHEVSESKEEENIMLKAKDLWKQSFMESFRDKLSPNVNTDSQLDSLWEGIGEQKKIQWKCKARSSVLQCHHNMENGVKSPTTVAQAKSDLGKVSSSANIGGNTVLSSVNAGNTKTVNGVTSAFSNLSIVSRSTSSSPMSSSSSAPGISPTNSNNSLSDELDRTSFLLWKHNFLKSNKKNLNGIKDADLIRLWQNASYDERHKWRSLAGGRIKRPINTQKKAKKVKGAPSQKVLVTPKKSPRRCRQPGTPKSPALVLDLPKPQENFKFPVNNSKAPFVPILTRKPNTLLKSLISFSPAYKVDKNGVAYYEHPYKEEIEAWKPNERQMAEAVLQPPKPNSLALTPFTVVQTHEEVLGMLEHLKMSHDIAIDLEHHDARTYLGITCLMQISTRTRDYVVDTLAPTLFGNLECLNIVFTDPNITKVLHGSQSDIEWLQRDLGLYIVGMFDTGIAGECIYGKKLSLKHFLETIAGVKDVDKSYQRVDWRIRPLPKDMLHYARVDTHYLLYIYDCLKNKTIKAGKLWTVYKKSSERCLIRYEKPTGSPEKALKEIRASLNARQIFAFQELFKWRDSLAREKDESVHYVLPLKSLERLAQSLPRDEMCVTEILESSCNDRVTPLLRENMPIILTILQSAVEILIDEEKALESVEKLKLQEVTSSSAIALRPGQDFRKLPVIPKLLELFSPAKNFLRPNIVIGAFPNVEDYLDIQFRLLREDFLRSVKAGLKDYLEKKRHHAGIKVHKTIDLIGINDQGDVLQLQLQRALLKRVMASDSKRFISGSLVLFTNDNFRKTYMGLIMRGDKNIDETNGKFSVHIRGEKELGSVPWRPGQGFWTIECDAYFEPYRSVMTALKEISWLKSISLWKYLQNGYGKVDVPKYLKNQSLKIGGHKANPVDGTGWPSASDLGFDIAQFNAYKAALTQEFVLIQGPPGTGKTYLGLQLIKTLMENQEVWRSGDGGPIIVVCYTNHALDQFGEGILNLFTPSEFRNSKVPYSVKYPRMYRIGMSCQSDRLMEYSAPNGWSGKSVDIVLMTTTGAAMRISKIKKLRSRIMIVEEAAEVIESHVVACLTPHIEHLILLGDHQQLRPITASGELTYAYHMDVSLFERMVKNNFPRYQLEVQHRMRPEIRDLITGTIYPKLTDYGNVLLYPSVTGMAERLYFIDHRELETELQDESFSRSNHHEAKFLGALCSYLLSQGHQPEKITVLGMYLSQVKLLENEIWGSRQISRNLRVETADSFQGEENNIILLSLVRSNTRNSIGFMKTDNRICVALSRAKHGLYIIGNMELLAANSSTWKAIKMKLASKGRIGRRLTLICDKHEPDVPTLVGNSRDIDNLVGGCRVCRELAVEADNAAKQRRLKKKTEKLKKKIKSATFVSSQYSEF